MRLRTKIMLCFLVTTSLAVGASAWVVNARLSDVTLNNKTGEYEVYIRQTLSATALVMKDIESSLYDLSAGMGLAQSVNDGETAAAIKKRDIDSKLRYMCYDNTYFEAMFLIGMDGAEYFGATSMYEQAYDISRIAGEREADLKKQYTAWFKDEKGRVYIKKDIYTVTPLYRAGMLVVRLNTEYVRSILGLDIGREEPGYTALMYGTGGIVLENGGMQDGLASQLSGFLDGKTSYSGAFAWNGEQYVLVAASYQHAWQAVRLVALSDILAIPYFVRNVSILTGILSLVFSALLLLALTQSLARNVNRLDSAMSSVSRGRFDVSIPIKSRDEIGRLTEKFNWLLKELKIAIDEMVARATEKKQAEYEMLELKYRSLQSQVSPHFICNILTSVSALTSLNRPQKVSDLAVLAGRYLRENLQNADQKFVPLREELKSVEDYLALYAAVYGGDLRLELSVEEGLQEQLVPNMLLQPLVENTVVHGGAAQSGGTCSVSIRVTGGGGRMTLQIRDNGCGMDDALVNEIMTCAQENSCDRHLKGFGLRGVLQRLRLLYDTDQQFEIRRADGGGTQINITIPLVGGLPPAHDNRDGEDSLKEAHGCDR